jgi:hypothetical protein
MTCPLLPKLEFRALDVASPDINGAARGWRDIPFEAVCVTAKNVFCYTCGPHRDTSNAKLSCVGACCQEFRGTEFRALFSFGKLTGDALYFHLEVP